MTRKLDVYLNNSLIGEYEQNNYGQTLFTYAPAWLDDSRAIVLSVSLPLRSEPFSQRECHHYFSGLLPDDSVRAAIARNLGISANNDFSMLERIGGECAGAVTFVPQGEPLSDCAGDYSRLTEQELVEVLEKLPTQPLLAGEKDLRLSLAGAQDKIAVFVDDDGQVSLPLKNAPSNCILKPATEHYPQLVSNECMCLSLASMIGLLAAKSKIGFADGIEYLLVERYDRTRVDGRMFPIRQHQEDFCQALGVSPNMKYQSDGGPNLKDCFMLMRHNSSRPGIDFLRLLDLVIFNIIIGNHDAHGKNFSLLYDTQRNSASLRLAPAYDILSTVYYPHLTSRMAMKIGKNFESGQLRSKDIERFATDVGMSAGAVRKRFVELAQAVKEKLPLLKDQFPKVHDLISLIDGRASRIVHVARGGSTSRV